MSKISVSRESSADKGVKRFGDFEVVTVIKPEEPTPNTSSLVFGSTPGPRRSQTPHPSYCSQPIRRLSDGAATEPCCNTEHPDCKCNESVCILGGKMIAKSSSCDVGKIIKEREQELEGEFKQQMNNEIAALKEKFDYVLQNEEMRSAFMLREARRECHEKIRAMQNQLECKNAANLMYVMASERRKGKIALLKMQEEYTNYIKALKSLLIEGQEIILNLSRGYKTAASVNDEWREKMKTVLKEFQNFVLQFGDGNPTQCQYFFDFPKALGIAASTNIDRKVDPCEEIPLEPLDETEKPWWERLGDEDRPFVVYGNMGDFKPAERREVLRQVRLNKNRLAPRTWKEYAFNDMFIKGECKNWNEIKDKYRGAPTIPTAYLEMLSVPTTEPASSWVDSISAGHNHVDHCKRMTLPSIDTKTNMGSILKLITATCTGSEPVTKAVLLGAKDSVELASQARMNNKERRKSSHVPPEPVTLNVGNRRASTIQQLSEEIQEYEYLKPSSSENLIHSYSVIPTDEVKKGNLKKEPDEDESLQDLPTSLLGSLHRDSIEVVQHVPDADSKMAKEKFCPAEECKLTQMDSFIRSLPSYMKASPYLLYEQTFDNYETCSPEQLRLLKERIETKAAKSARKSEKYSFKVEDPLREWEGDGGIATQTTWSHEELPPPCSCPIPSPTPQSIGTPGQVYNAEDLMSIKQMIDHVTFNCLYNNHIERNRFELVGEAKKEYDRRTAKEDFKDTKDRIYEIKKILDENPSLLSIFQGNRY